MKLFQYQTNLSKEMNKHLKLSDKVILGATTGAGKTEILIDMIKKSKRRWLVLTHGQRTIRENFADRLKDRKVKSFEVRNGEEAATSDRHRVVVALPQNIHKVLKLMKSFDYLVVDEAHEYYGEEKRMYKKILDWNKGKQILMTATHYDLTGPKVVFSKEQAMEQGRLVDATVRWQGVEKLKLADEDFTSSGDLSETINLTKSTYDKVEELLTRTKSTMIITPNTLFASKLYKRLKKQGVDAAVSDCYTDADSEELAKFKQGKVRVLVVVMRGNIGFDYPNLEHVIDASYTKNIKRLEQLLGRLLRNPTKKIGKKVYDKLIPSYLFGQYYIYMTGVMALGVTDVYRSWTGKNASLPIKLPGDGTSRAKAIVDDITIGKFKVNGWYETSFGEYTSIWKGDTLSTTVGKALRAIKGGEDPDGNKREILEFVKKHGRRPSTAKPEEKKMRGRMENYCNPGKNVHDPEFRAELEALTPKLDSSKSKQEILEWVKKHGRKPSQYKPEEKKMCGRMKGYCSPSHDTCDPEFKEQLHALLEEMK
ncbi:DEAD/DEAH box helicase family protein [bacterium]|nr:DEAD/DEAH box helicase family protein [bacterium]